MLKLWKKSHTIFAVSRIQAREDRDSATRPAELGGSLLPTDDVVDSSSAGSLSSKLGQKTRTEIPKRTGKANIVVSKTACLVQFNPWCHTPTRLFYRAQRPSACALCSHLDRPWVYSLLVRPWPWPDAERPRGLVERAPVLCKLQSVWVRPWGRPLSLYADCRNEATGQKVSVAAYFVEKIPLRPQIVAVKDPLLPPPVAPRVAPTQEPKHPAHGQRMKPMQKPSILLE